MRPTSHGWMVCTFLGVAFVACSSDDSNPSASADPPRTNTEANQPSSMNPANPGMSAAAAGASGASNSQTPAATPPTGAGEATPGDLGLNPGAGGSGNAGGGMNGTGNQGQGGGTEGGAGQNGAAGAGGGAGAGNDPNLPEPTSDLSIFVATASDSGGDLGGLAGADATCEALAAGVGAGDRTWRAYLSTSTIDARDRIGDGPWINANGVLVATDLDDLHSLSAARGTPLVELFLDPAGNRINGQWAGSPGPNQHDMLTGSAPDGTALAATCNDWTSSTATPGPQVGHSDGLGPGMNGAGNLGSWNSSHAPQGCSQQQLIAVGGAGRFYCFAAD